MSFFDVLLGRKHAPMVGLDISSSSVKLVELDQTPAGEFVLQRFASEPFEKGWISDGQIEKFDEVADAVRRVVTRSGTKTKHVVMAMPQSAVITKKIMLPAGLREEELELQVESEANQYIPFSLDEVSLDFCVIGPSTTSAGDVEVLIAASRKDRVQDRQGLAEAAGRRWLDAARALTLAATVTLIWISIQLFLIVAFNYSYAGSASADVFGGGYLRLWATYVSPRVAAATIFGELGALFLLIPIGFIRSGPSVYVTVASFSGCPSRVTVTLKAAGSRSAYVQSA